METYPRKTQKGCELKSLGRSCGQGSFKFSKPGFKGEFVLNQIRSITIQYSCINCISAPSICITKNLLLCFFFFFLLKGRLITNTGSVTNTGLICRVLLTTGFPFIAHSLRSKEVVSLGDPVEKCFFVSVSSACQQSRGKQPSLLGLLSVSNTSSLESEA